MSGPIAVFLCDKTGIMAEPWAAAGIECFCVDIQHSIRRDILAGSWLVRLAAQAIMGS